MKIMTADSTSTSQELFILRALAANCDDDTSSIHIVRLLDDFLEESPHGHHQCLVFELLGPTVDIIVNDYHEEGERLDAETILNICLQLLQTVEFIHKAGYAHGGKAMFFMPAGLF